jgi:hypothetical protein
MENLLGIFGCHSRNPGKEDEDVEEKPRLAMCAVKTTRPCRIVFVLACAAKYGCTRNLMGGAMDEEEREP